MTVRLVSLLNLPSRHFEFSNAPAGTAWNKTFQSKRQLAYMALGRELCLMLFLITTSPWNQPLKQRLNYVSIISFLRNADIDLFVLRWILNTCAYKFLAVLRSVCEIQPVHANCFDMSGKTKAYLSVSEWHCFQSNLREGVCHDQVFK